MRKEQGAGMCDVGHVAAGRVYPTESDLRKRRLIPKGEGGF